MTLQREQAERSPESRRAAQTKGASRRAEATTAPRREPPAHALGNQQLQRLLARGALRPKLTMNAPDDPFERQADRVAAGLQDAPEYGGPKEAVLPAGVAPAVQRACAECEDELVSRKPLAGAASGRANAEQISPDAQAGIEALRGRGQPLPPGTRRFFEGRLGYDFERVRVHTDGAAAQTAASIGAAAYTLGQDVVFGAGRYSPDSAAGRALLAHELTHVVQQSGGAHARRGSVAADTPARAEIATAHSAPAPLRVARQRVPPPGGAQPVSSIEILRDLNQIIFHTNRGTFTYDLLGTNLQDGEFEASVTVQGNNISIMVTQGEAGSGTFSYRIRSDQSNPSTFFGAQRAVHVSVHNSVGAGATGPIILGEIPVVFVANGPLGGLGGSGVPSLLDLAGSGGLRSTGLAQINPLPQIGGTSTESSSGIPGWPLTTLGLSSNILASGSHSWGPATRPLTWDYWAPMVPRAGDVTLDRFTNTLPRNLDPTLVTELANRQPGDPLAWTRRSFQPDPASAVTRTFTEAELRSIPDIVRRFSADPASVSAAELQLVREAAAIHIGGATPGSPFASYSVPEGAVNLGGRRYVVRVEVQRGAALDVSAPNAFNQQGTLPGVTNVEELEVLVVTNQSGRIVSVEQLEQGANAISRSSEAGWAFRNAGNIRWGGRILFVAGLAMSGYRIAEATPQERPVVVAEEAGGLGGGWAGGALATAGCIAFGIATEGVGLLLCGLVGGAAGGALGSAGAGAAARSIVNPSPSGSGWERRSMFDYCFASDARVLLADESWRPIADVRAGDRVVAYDESTGTLAPAEVTLTHRHARQPFITLSADGGAVLRVTPNHPLRSRGRWTPAGALVPGDPLAVLDAGRGGVRSAAVSGVADEGCRDDVFNLTVDGLHTYVVEGVVVHNKIP